MEIPSIPKHGFVMFCSIGSIASESPFDLQLVAPMAGRRAWTGEWSICGASQPDATADPAATAPTRRHCMEHEEKYASTEKRLIFI